jgi:hypothetical protein
VGDRQRACSSPDCQAKRRKAQQAAWRKRNQDYFAARRIEEKRLREKPRAPALKPPLDRLPWDLAQTQFGTQGAEFIAVFGRLLVRRTQMQIRLQLIDTS